MNDLLQEALFFLLGFLGLGAVGLLPYRSWQLLRFCLGRRSQSASQKVMITWALATVVTALGADLQIASRIYRCLNETYCGPNIASGWIYLSMLGIVYLVFEIAGYFMRKVGRALSLSKDHH
ncbi:hypothetical protein [Leptothrix ochracea]|uniref:hypothetical protein n=1 Tax=Leptothrix ochracea TaxID=735331 RepID=UPI0034E26A93